MTRLEEFAQPFGLMDLPNAVQARICSYAINANRETWQKTYNHRRRIYECEQDYDGLKLFDGKIHPLAHTCRQLRMISLTMSVSNGIFNFHEGSDITEFATSFGPANVKHLRKVDFAIDVCLLEEEDVSFTFILSLTYSKRDGLGIEITCNKDYKLTHFSSEKLHILFKSVFGTASACDLQGQALLMALTSRSDLWKEAVLKCEPNAPWQEEGSAK